MINIVQCNSCNWLSFEISLEETKKYDHDFTKCYKCQESYLNFRDCTLNDNTLYGQTIQPILERPRTINKEKLEEIL